MHLSFLRTMSIRFIALFLLFFAGTVSAALDSKGTDFWLMFNQNLGTPALTLFITGDVATTGTVDIPGVSFTAPFSVTPGTVTSVVIPAGAQAVGADSIEDKGIHVIAVSEVTVYGLNRVKFTTDAFLGLPTDILGTDYINLSYEGSSQFGVVATQANTTVTITPTVTVGARIAGTPYNITLNQGQTYQLRGSPDLSGSLISSDKPIAVFGSAQCVNIPPSASFCDHIVEQLPPTNTWGKSFLTVPLATRLKGDTFRILASQNNTQITINGALVATLNKGKFHEQIIAVASEITASNPVLVAQYSNGTSFDGVTSDPFMMLVPPHEQFLTKYTVTTPASGFAKNFINMVAPNAAVGSVSLDGVAIPAASFNALGASGFSWAQLAVDLGSHNLADVQPFGIFVYGFDSFDSYGYPGGMSLSKIATVTKVDLTPKTETVQINSSHCTNALVTDQGNQPVPDVRVDFTVTGANPNVGNAKANANGIAQYCYTGTNVGSDTIVGAVGTLSNTVTKQWVSVVNGVCGSDNTKTLIAPPANPLCTQGTASVVTTSNTSYKWSCQGSNGGTNASCSAIRNYVVSTSVVGGNGTISASQNVAFNATPTITLTPAAGFIVGPVTGTCGGSLSGNNYTTNKVTANCTVVASFVTAPARTFTGPTATGTGNATATLGGGGTTCGFSSAKFVPVPASAALPGFTFPHGLFEITLTRCSVGSTVQVSITYPSALSAGLQYWKYGPESGNATPHWYSIPAAIAGNTATFSLTDGGLGDGDLTANGSIVDPSGPGVPVAAAVSAPTAIPTLSEWSLMLLVGMLGLFGMAAGAQRRFML